MRQLDILDNFDRLDRLDRLGRLDRLDQTHKQIYRQDEVGRQIDRQIYR